ncbi:hypothetical protein [Aerobium aerolatum]|uniref:Uncharacterized protein n=1 Tax=Aquamicrobium aerolatum DSM 21857 TaxID=1121003 RepID=A0A1I3JLU2_9HYPH|nr:hypothetical protein [Aquamicrobium aerolatum]SFI61213.1 hypothetical protein SAMN03080618_00908 [Aquamicrobium aerolatum DSM 21857]
MDMTKQWYQSRTIWASLLVVVSLGAAALGFPLVEGETDALAEAILQTIAAGAGVAAIIGRICARSRIG